jgi:hypothetical protein
VSQDELCPTESFPPSLLLSISEFVGVVDLNPCSFSAWNGLDERWRCVPCARSLVAGTFGLAVRAVRGITINLRDVRDYTRGRRKALTVYPPVYHIAVSDICRRANPALVSYGEVSFASKGL